MSVPPTIETRRAPTVAEVDPLFEIQGNRQASFVRYVPELERDQFVIAARDWNAT